MRRTRGRKVGKMIIFFSSLAASGVPATGTTYYSWLKVGEESNLGEKKEKKEGKRRILPVEEKEDGECY